MIWRKGTPSAAVEEKPKGFDDYDLRLGDLMRGERATLGKSLLDVQRELKIKATYIAAIENADISAFATPGFVAGYVRSYARYLNMDPDAAYRQFCAEANFCLSPHAAPSVPSARTKTARPRPKGLDALGDPNALFVPRDQSWTSRIEPGAAGSVLVLLALIAGIGYGGWSVLREVQRVQVAPIEQAPSVVASIDPLGAVATGETLRLSEAAPVAPTAEALGRLYRPQALEVPVMVARDGPIGAIKVQRDTSAPHTQFASAETYGPMPATEAEAEPTEVRVLAQAAPPVEIIAVQPAWVRIRAADGTVLFEKVLNTGESYIVPQSEAPPTLRAGNSSAVYFLVNGQTHGPAAAGSSVVSNVALSPDALSQKYALVDLNAKPEVARFVELAQSRHAGETTQD